MSPHTVVNAIWIVVGVVWAVSALRSPRTAPPVARGPSLAHYVLSACAFVLVFRDDWRVGLLGERFLPASPAWAAAGLALTLTGAAFAIWARLGLGRHWASSVSIAADHALVRRGPYRLVRHPIYAGLLLALAGTALVIGEVRAAVGAGLALVAWLRKARAEETLLLARFGGEYARYRREVKAFIPYVL